MNEFEYQSSRNLPTRCRPTPTEEEALITARIAFMTHGRFFAYYFFDQMEEYLTRDIQTLATDGKRCFINPGYFLTLKPMERAFTLAHETAHTILKHPQLLFECNKTGTIAGLPFDKTTVNIAMDLILNANLVNDKIGSCNPSWLFDPDVTGSEAVEEVYRKIYVPPPPMPPKPPGGTKCPEGPMGPGNGKGQPQQPQGQPQGPSQPQPQPQPQDQPTAGTPNAPTYGRGSIKDKTADANNGQFDEVLPPRIDPVTGEADQPSEMEFKEAIAKAANAAREAGQMPGSFERVVRDILEPQVRWQDHLRFTVAGKIGRRKESWATPNRRYVVLGKEPPLMYLPGKAGHGCEDVNVVLDNSGSITRHELAAFFAEAGAILADCKPRLVRVQWCDAKVQRVEEARCLDELEHIRVEGSPGGGGTDFRPPFAWLKERGIKPDTLVYLTDGFPSYGWPQDPGYPVIWVITTDVVAPWGETVHIKV